MLLCGTLDTQQAERFSKCNVRLVRGLSLQQKPIIDRYAGGKIDVWMPAVNMIVRYGKNAEKTKIKIKSLFYDYGLVFCEGEETGQDLYELFYNQLHCQMLKGFCLLEVAQISQINDVIYKQEGKPKIYFEVGDLVVIRRGPFAHMQGKVSGVGLERVKVEMFMMGRVLPAEFEMEMVERVI